MKMIHTLGAAAILLVLALGGKTFAQDKQIEIFTKDDDGDDDGMMMLGLDAWANMPAMEMSLGDMMDGDLPGMEMGGPGMLPDELNLSKDQTDKIKKIHNTVRKQNIPIKSDIELKRIELKELMDNDSPEKDKIASKIKEIDALKTQMSINRVNGVIDFKNVLTKDQREKLEKMRMNRRRMLGRSMRMRHFDRNWDSMGKDRDGTGKDKDWMRKDKEKDKD